jgi:hypothetical protein
MPATKPTLTLSAIVPPIGGASSLGGPITDPSTTLAAYEVAHTINIPSVNYKLSTAREFLRFIVTGETGANSIVGFRFFSVTFKIAH